MPPKRQSPLEDPPSASSTDDTEDEVEASEEEGSEDEEGSEEEQEQQPKLTQPPPRSTTKPKPVSTQTPVVANPQSSDDDDEEGSDEEEKADLGDGSGSETGSDSDNEPVKHMIAHRNPDVKPISSSKPIEPPKPKKPSAPSASASAASLPTPTPTPKSSSAVKRPLDDDKSEKKDRKDRKKKRVADLEDEEETEKKTGEDKKSLIQRIWSEEDEIVLLKGLIEYKKKGNNPFTNMGGFLDFIKNKIHAENINKGQLINKVQRLKQKYQNNAGRAKPGEDPVISRPHELSSYVLSKQIWGELSGKDVKDDGVEANHTGSESLKSDVKKSKNQVNSNGVATPKGKVSKVVPNSPKVLANVKGKEEATVNGPEFIFLNGSLQSPNVPVMPMPPLGLGEIFAKKGWESIKSLDPQSLDERWKNVLIAETKVYLERIELVRDQTKAMLDALLSSEI